MSPICKCIFEHLVRQDFQNLGDGKGTKAHKNVLKSSVKEKCYKYLYFNKN